MGNRWKDRTPAEKVLTASRIAVSIGVVASALLKLFEVWDKALHVAVPLMGVNLVLISIQEWKRSRVNAIASICSAAFIFICTIVMWLVK